MNPHAKSALVLAGLLAVSAAMLAGTHSLTNEKIMQARAELADSRISRVFPSADSVIETAGYMSVYNGQRLLGYAAQGTARGYAGDITVIAGFSPQGRIVSVEVLSQRETPGLGSRIADKEFVSQLSGISIGQAVLKPEGGEIDSVTGATSSSRAATLAVRDAYEKIWGQNAGK